MSATELWNLTKNIKSRFQILNSGFCPTPPALWEQLMAGEEKAMLSGARLMTWFARTLANRVRS
jgi:hypothetical protein